MLKLIMKKGFTLIELLIVVAIIGILAAVGAAVIPGLLEKAKQTAIKTNHKNVITFFQLKSLQCDAEGKVTFETTKNSGQTWITLTRKCNHRNGWHLVEDLGYNYFRQQFRSDYFYKDLYENPYDPNTFDINPYWQNGCSNVKGRMTYYGKNTGAFIICTNLGNENIISTIQFPVN